MFAANAFAPVEDILDIDESTQFTFEEVSPHSSVESELFELLDQVIREGRLKKIGGNKCVIIQFTTLKGTF